MVKNYRRSNWRDDYNEYVELQQLDELRAVFHVAPTFNIGHVYHPPIDPEVGLTEDDLKDRIRKREAVQLEIDEEKKSITDFERYWQDPRRRKAD